MMAVIVSLFRPSEVDGDHDENKIKGLMSMVMGSEEADETGSGSEQFLTCEAYVRWGSGCWQGRTL